MKLIEPYYEILDPLDEKTMLERIERVARTCYKSEKKIKEGSALKLVQSLIDNGHGAMLEFANITVRFIVDRGVTHELVRHRIASFAQESTRYCNYGKDDDITFIIPSWLTNDIKPGIYTELEEMESSNDYWFNHMRWSEKTYNYMINNGWSPQKARSVLPNSLKTEINVGANIREWRHIFKLRAINPKAHPDMRYIMLPLLAEFKLKLPTLFGDIKPKQISLSK